MGDKGSSILKAKLEEVRSLKAKKCSRLDNVPCKLIKHDEEVNTEAMKTLYQKTWKEKKWLKKWT
ncbi:hypothetical protein DPMN_163007 [Dreissena polymorpha]|uniref:Uncharacterized protein n=1 Tax=Dreissena polymorpha TaxID=45954 RepID=A0A9D4ESG1_DREPO|nr:hypothetical protein DPMN_163007 [Dreissena polymorpha]